MLNNNSVKSGVVLIGCLSCSIDVEFCVFLLAISYKLPLFTTLDIGVMRWIWTLGLNNLLLHCLFRMTKCTPPRSEPGVKYYPLVVRTMWLVIKVCTFKECKVFQETWLATVTSRISIQMIKRVTSRYYFVLKWESLFSEPHLFPFYWCRPARYMADIEEVLALRILHALVFTFQTNIIHSPKTHWYNYICCTGRREILILFYWIYLRYTSTNTLKRKKN